MSKPIGAQEATPDTPTSSSGQRGPASPDDSSPRRAAAVTAATLLILTALTALWVTGGLTATPPEATTRTYGSTAADDFEAIEVPSLRPCRSVSTSDRSRPYDSTYLPMLVLPCLTGGRPVEVSRLGGQPIVVNLWATWCTPCREEMPVLQAAADAYQGRAVFVGVDTRDRPEAAAAFLDKLAITYPQLVDLDGELLDWTRVPGLPVTLVLDPDGRVVDRHVGALSAADVRDLLDPLVAP